VSGRRAAAGPARTLRRSLRLLVAFRGEQRDPDRFYGLLSQDATELLAARVPLAGRLVVDVGGGAGYLSVALAAAGARPVVVEPDRQELTWRGGVRSPAVIGDGRHLPVRDGAADLVVCSNVLEHVDDGPALLAELARIVRPGGHVWVSFTNWWSPWGGHETSPWHLLGGERARRRYERRTGREAKNRFGETLFPVHVGRTLRLVRSLADMELVDAGARYHPSWARGVVRLPGLRELATWNLELLLRRRRGGGG
jgi:SAM-dependent methyltransferase